MTTADDALALAGRAFFSRVAGEACLQPWVQPEKPGLWRASWTRGCVFVGRLAYDKAAGVLDIALEPVRMGTVLPALRHSVPVGKDLPPAALTMAAQDALDTELAARWGAQLAHQFWGAVRCC